jgi:carbamoyl-phosphate synthase small subunit
VEITSQNHGFAVTPSSVGPSINVTSVNLNDQTIEGISHKDLPIYSVQYHPEASPGPHDSSHLFQKFTNLMKAEVENNPSK